MSGTPPNPSDEEAVRRLLEETGVEPTAELNEVLLSLREAGKEPAPAAGPELEALLSAGVSPLRKPSRRRGFLFGGAVLAAMAAGTTGVAATSQAFRVTAETSQDVPSPVSFEEIPAPTPTPVPEPDRSAVPETVPEAVPDPAASADPAAPAAVEKEATATAGPAEQQPADGPEPGTGADRGSWQPAGHGYGYGREDHPERSSGGRGNGQGGRPGDGGQDLEHRGTGQGGSRGYRDGTGPGGWQLSGEAGTDSGRDSSSGWQPGDGHR